MNRLDANGIPLSVGDRVIVARPASYDSKAARLEEARIVAFTAKGVTLQFNNASPPLYDPRTYSTPYRANKFWRLDD